VAAGLLRQVGATCAPSSKPPTCNHDLLLLRRAHGKYQRLLPCSSCSKALSRSCLTLKVGKLAATASQALPPYPVSRRGTALGPAGHGASCHLKADTAPSLQSKTRCAVVQVRWFSFMHWLLCLLLLSARVVTLKIHFSYGSICIRYVPWVLSTSLSCFNLFVDL
jgi:hypothetical protein